MVTPQYLDLGQGSYDCTADAAVRDHTYCTVMCSAEGGVVWRAAACEEDVTGRGCPPWERVTLPWYQPDAPLKPPSAIHGPVNAQPALDSPSPPVVHHLRGDAFTGAAMLATADLAEVALVKSFGGFNLRGLQVRYTAVDVGMAMGTAHAPLMMMSTCLCAV